MGADYDHWRSDFVGPEVRTDQLDFTERERCSGYDVVNAGFRHYLFTRGLVTCSRHHRFI
jgi:hypothetical protein